MIRDPKARTIVHAPWPEQHGSPGNRTFSLHMPSRERSSAGWRPVEEMQHPDDEPIAADARHRRQRCQDHREHEERAQFLAARNGVFRNFRTCTTL